MDRPTQRTEGRQKHEYYQLIVSSVDNLFILCMEWLVAVSDEVLFGFRVPPTRGNG